MDYVSLIVLAAVVLICLISKLIAASIIARQNISTAKAKVISQMFDFNPSSIFKKD